MTSVCVIGAGIVGCATAYQLARIGFAVHLVDAADAPGTVTSFANGGQLSYSYVEPLASPATLRALPGMLLSADSPLKFRLRAEWRQWRWGLRFLAACRAGAARRGTARLLDLARTSRKTLEAWMRSEAWSFAFERNGKLVLCPDAATLRRQVKQVQLQAIFGCVQEALTREECLEREPALALGNTRFVGGVWTPDECVADPFLLCRELVGSLKRLGGSASFGTSVSGFARDGTRLVAAHTEHGDLHADAFVLCTGPNAAALAATVGLHLPIYPIKGYSLTLPFTGAVRPRASVTDLGRKTVFAPLGGQMRIAAMAEIGEYGLDIPSARLDAMLTGLHAVYPGLCDTTAPLAWAGLRPATPDSVPIVGRWADTNLFINAGHGALGFTLAAGSAARIADELARAVS